MIKFSNVANYTILFFIDTENLFIGQAVFTFFPLHALSVQIQNSLYKIIHRTSFFFGFYLNTL